jgi:hypothetical protein
MSDTPSRSSFLVTVSAVLGAVAVFVLIVVIAYKPNKPEPLQDGAKTPEERAKILQAHLSREEKTAAEYAWIDQSKGVVQLPIDRAIDLTIKDLNSAK